MAACLRVLNHDNRIGAPRYHSAGRNQHCVAAMNCRGRDNSCVYLFFAQHHAARNFLRRAERIFRHNGESIDIRAIERRHVDGRYDLGR